MQAAGGADGDDARDAEGAGGARGGGRRRAEGGAVGGSEGAKAVVLSIVFILKTIILPRQARDKHRKKLTMERFLGRI